MENYFSIIVSVVGILFTVLLWGGILLRLVRNHLSKTIEVPATVVDKQSYTKSVLFRGQAPTEKQVYLVTFLAKGKKQAFEVSKISFDGYAVNQKGILKYQGTRLLDFEDE